MNAGAEAIGIVVCGLRPQASLVHLLTLAAFVWFSFRLSPR
jgi:hypothetical protein